MSSAFSQNMFRPLFLIDDVDSTTGPCKLLYIKQKLFRMSTGCQKAKNTDRQEERQAGRQNDRLTEMAGQLKSPLLFGRGGPGTDCNSRTAKEPVLVWMLKHNYIHFVIAFPVNLMCVFH